MVYLGQAIVFLAHDFDPTSCKLARRQKTKPLPISAKLARPQQIQTLRKSVSLISFNPIRIDVKILGQDSSKISMMSLVNPASCIQY